MKILIVGSTGFVGQNLVRFLTNHNIGFCCLDRKKGVSKENYTWNALESIPFNDISNVFFLTGKAHDLKKAADDQIYYDVNVGLLKQFIISAESNGFNGQFIYVSSVKAIADVVKDVLNEDDAPEPKTVYGKSKLEAENYLLSTYLSSKAFVLRPCMIHGEGNKGNLNQLFSIVNKGIPNILSSFQNERSLLSIDNLLFVFHKIIDFELKPDVYHISDTGYLSLGDMFRVISETIGKEYKKISVPKILIKLLALVGDLVPLPLNSERLQKLTENYKVSNSKLLKSLNCDLPVSAENGLQKTIESFK